MKNSKTEPIEIIIDGSEIIDVQINVGYSSFLGALFLILPHEGNQIESL